VSSPPDVPRAREITEGMHGDDVVAVKHALSRAGYLRWGTFTPLWGPGVIAAAKNFQNDHGVPPGPGTYGPLTHAALVATHRKGSDTEWAYDAHAIALMQAFCDHLTAKPAAGVRGAIVAEAARLFGRRDEIDYDQGRPFLLLKPQSVPHKLDCSGFITVCHFVGGAPDPNGSNYDGNGYTGTLISTGQPCAQNKLEAGDIVLYGATTTARPGFPIGSPTHVALFDGADGVYSQGGPNPHDRMARHPVNYRTVNHYRHYNL
jgi:peptidoglycan hydrolase-like protein with peptidoglycan-binding domain